MKEIIIKINVETGDFTVKQDVKNEDTNIYFSKGFEAFKEYYKKDIKYNKKKLADKFGVSRPTIYKWIEDIKNS